MKDKSKFIFKIMALLFAGAITAASLVACGYGTQPVSGQNQENETQTEQNALNDNKDN